MSVKSLFSRGFHPTSDQFTIEVKPSFPPDDSQKVCIESEAENIVIVAGAGSGKTKVLTERVKYLIGNKGIAPSNVVAITFTNLAAEEMKERLLDVPGIGDAFIGTIHSFANRLMQHSGKEYEIYSDNIENKYMEILIKKYCNHLTFDRFIEYKDLLNKMELGKVSESEVQDFFVPSERAEYRILTRKKEEVEADMKYCDVPESVDTLCKENNVLTFDELLELAEEYFRGMGAHVEHLLVDEFQDIGHLEFRFIEGLQADHNFFVGDDWQAIYGFKGGCVDIFKRIVEDSGFNVYYLNNNYRNALNILDVAKTVISQVTSKIDKTIVPMNKSEGSVTVLSKGRLESVLLTNVYSSDTYKDWFILTRTNKELFHIAELCAQLQIPFVTFRREGMTLAELRRAMSLNRVKILTVHTSKGLEAKNVILYGRFPIVCPSYMKDEEERKVMYVGITRAEENLYILN